MGRMYVANTTNQAQTIMYRLTTDRKGDVVENAKFREAYKETLPPHGLKLLGGDMHPVQIAEIEEQLRVYGMHSVKDIRDGNLVGVVPYIWNFEPIQEDDVRRVLQHNAKSHVEIGKQRRMEAAIAAAKISGVESMEVSIEQVASSGMGETPVAEGFRVTTAEALANPPGSRGKKGGNRG